MFIKPNLNIKEGGFREEVGKNGAISFRAILFSLVYIESLYFGFRKKRLVDIFQSTGYVGIDEIYGKYFDADFRCIYRIAIMRRLKSYFYISPLK